MKLQDKFYIGYRIIKARVLNDRLPLFVGWSLTNRCNLNCRYCNRPNNKVKELEISEIRLIIDQLKKLGTKFISFTGGEPLLRADIEEIIQYACKSGFYININSNGTLFEEKRDLVKHFNSVKLSLDGPPEIHNYIRGKESHEKVIEAIKIAKRNRVRADIVTVLSKYNIDSLPYLLELSEELDVKIAFQPATLTLLGSNILNSCIPDIKKYRDAIDALISYKKKNKPILNTMKGLEYLRQWPEGMDIFCYGRNVSCRIETDGYLYHCLRREDKVFAHNCLMVKVKEAFDNLSPLACKDCWCVLRLELNYISSLDFSTILAFLKDNA